MIQTQSMYDLILWTSRTSKWKSVGMRIYIYVKAICQHPCFLCEWCWLTQYEVCELEMNIR